MKLVAVLPTYNEVANLEECVATLLALRLPGVDLGVQIVDDNSPDGTGKLAERLVDASNGRVAVLHRPSKMGLGRAYVAGFAAALAGQADFVAQLDADLSHDPKALLTMVERIASCDLVLGSRYIEGGSVDTEWAWRRHQQSRLANRYIVQTLLELPISDATTGYRLWRADALRRIDPAHHVSSSGYGFQVEMCLLAHRHGLRIVEVPIHFIERGRGRSKMTASVQLAAVRDILALRWRHRHASRG